MTNIIFALIFSLLVSDRDSPKNTVNESVLVRSDDLGVTWSDASTGLPKNFVASVLDAGNKQLMSNMGDNLYIFDNTNNTWDTFKNQHEFAKIFYLSSGIYLKSYENGYFKWQQNQLVPAFKELENKYAYTIIEKPNGGYILSCDDGVFELHNQTLTKINNAKNLTIIQLSDGKLVGGNNSGLMISADFGHTWSIRAKDEAYVMKLQQQENIILATQNQQTSFKDATSLGFDFLGQNTTNTVYKATISFDQGRNWQKLNLPAIQHPSSLDLTMVNNLIFCTLGNQVFRTDNYGKTWLHLYTASKIKPLKIENMGRTIFIANSFSGC